MHYFPQILFKVNNKYFSIEWNSKESVRMATVINYQLSMFGKFSISPTPETIFYTYAGKSMKEPNKYFFQI